MLKLEGSIVHFEIKKEDMEAVNMNVRAEPFCTAGRYLL